LDHFVSALSTCHSLQATFDISLTTTTGLTALSNMPVIATQDLSSGDITTHFATEPGQPDRNVSIYGTPDRQGMMLFWHG